MIQVKAIRAAARFSYLLFLLACAARIFFYTGAAAPAKFSEFSAPFRFLSPADCFRARAEQLSSCLLSIRSPPRWPKTSVPVM